MGYLKNQFLGVVLTFVANHDATCTWSGVLPPKKCENPIYSCKVFLGGVPWDITEGKSVLDLSSLHIPSRNILAKAVVFSRSYHCTLCVLICI